MVDPLHEIAYGGIARMEHELLVRDFLELMSVKECGALEPFLRDDVRYSASTGSQLVGRPAVVEMCREIIDTFAVFGVDLVRISSVDNAVLVEERVLVAIEPGGEPQHLMGFAVFEIVDMQIAVWRQLHG